MKKHLCPYILNIIALGVTATIIKNISDIAKAMNLDESAIYNEIEPVISQLQSSNIKYFVNKQAIGNGKLIGVTRDDIAFISSGYKAVYFMDLVTHFGVDTNDMLWLLKELAERNIINEEVRGWYTKEGENQPSVKAWFEPETITVGEKSTLNIEINSPCEIYDPKISIEAPSELEIEGTPKTPSKLFKGKYVEKYEFEASAHGDLVVVVGLGGTVEGIYFGKEPISAALSVKPLAPELIVSQNKSIYEAYSQDILELTLDIVNRGAGLAKNVELEGLENHPEFEVMEKIATKIGNIASHGSVNHKIALKTRKSGTFHFEDLKVTFQDSVGKPFSTPIASFEAQITTLQPNLQVAFDYPKDVEMKKPFTLILKISNMGEGDAKNLTFTLPFDPKYIKSGAVDCKIARLKSGQTEELAVTLIMPEKEVLEVPDFNIEFDDIEDKTNTQKVLGIPIHARAERKTINQVARRAIEKIKAQIPSIPSLPSTQSTPSEALQIKEINVELLKMGTPKDWLKQIEEAFSDNVKIKLPYGNHSEKEGYRNLLIALYSVKGPNAKKITSILADKSLIRIAEYLRNLKDGREITVRPSDSALTDLDETISVMCGRILPDKVRVDNVVTSIFKFADAYKNEVAIEKKITLNPVTKKADRISFILK